MINTLITSRTRIRLLLKFFLNPKTKGYLRQLSKEFNESTNSIRVELNKLTEAQILSSKSEGRNKIYNANAAHPLFEEIRSIVLKSTGIDTVINDIINKVGSIELAFIRGDYAIGKDSGLIDLVLVGEKLNAAEIERVKTKTESLIDRKINILILKAGEYKKLGLTFQKEPMLILFGKDAS